MNQATRSEVSVSTDPVLKAEWSCAGDSFVAIVVGERNEIVAEYWGSEDEVVGWMATNYKGIPSHFAPMARAQTA